VQAAVHNCGDPWAGAVGLLDGSDYIRRQGIRSVAPTNPLLEHALTLLAVEFALRDGGIRADPLIESYRSTDPLGVALALQLLSEQELVGILFALIASLLWLSWRCRRHA
jgi:hypothetical protein